MSGDALLELVKDVPRSAWPVGLSPQPCEMSGPGCEPKVITVWSIALDGLRYVAESHEPWKDADDADDDDDSSPVALCPPQNAELMFIASLTDAIVGEGRSVTFSVGEDGRHVATVGGRTGDHDLITYQIFRNSTRVEAIVDAYRKLHP